MSVKNKKRDLKNVDIIHRCLKHKISEKEIEKILTVETCRTAFNMLSIEKKLEFILSLRQLWNNYKETTDIDCSVEAIQNRNRI